MKINNGQFSSIEQVTGKYLNKKALTSSTVESSLISFNDILEEKKLKNTDGEINALKFSKHASERMTSRNINMSSEQMERLKNGTTQANEKGINESLVLVDDLAFIVNVKNNTVITAMEQSDNMENVYTNIDGAVII